ncbi:MAG: glycerol-3-phosphate dehydrogenase/oxidase [Dehalococcoidales bacterium]|nr:glycerol-3-phosphate dehydrogenase/oxidase [Dehalococcoidales bacterium]
MKRNFSDLDRKNYDVIVIGGGIIGSGIARDAALRGLNTLLVEKEDFAFGTTSRSTRLIHGGLRYLRMLEFKMVWQDLHEREVLMRIAPHLVQKLEFLIPLLRSTPLYRVSLPIGLSLYDILATGKSVPSRKHLSCTLTLKMEPALADTAGLAGSFVFYDCQAQNMERLCLENVLSADANGAVILNHAEATNFIIEKNVVKGIQLVDKVSARNHIALGRITVNAGGPWADIVWDRLKPENHSRLRRTMGVHLVTRKIANRALVLFAKSDGRLFFVIPWNNNSLIGTTDTDYSGDLDRVSADKAGVGYLVSETRNYFPQFSSEDVHYTVAGLRPLVASEEKRESNTSRSHKLIDHERKDEVQGLISILGGKITAYRAIAEETVDLVCRKLQVKIPCTTAQVLLPGAPAVSHDQIARIALENDLPVETIKHLAGIYGSRLFQLLEPLKSDPCLKDTVAPGYPDIRAEIKHAVEQEEAMTLNDYLLRRSLSGLGPDQGRGAAEAFAMEMGTWLGWSNTEKQKQIQDYQETLLLGQSFRQK